VKAVVTKPEALTSEVSNTFLFKFYVGEVSSGAGPGGDGAEGVEGARGATAGAYTRSHFSST